MKRILSILMAALILAVNSGCATTRGSPADIYTKNYGATLSADVPLRALATGKDTNGNWLSESTRNAHVFAALAVADVRYSEFQQELVSGHNHASSVSDALVLAMTIAGSLTGSAGVKENYLQGIALVTGGRSIYEKNYLQSQTIAALISQMDANRKKKRLEILTQMTQSPTAYPGPAAYNDIMAYYSSGTIIGALMGIQASAKKEAESTQDDIDTLMSSKTIQ
jgi:hypothetical protein